MLYNPSFHFIFHFLFHLILHYRGVISLLLLLLLGPVCQHRTYDRPWCRHSQWFCCAASVMVAAVPSRQWYLMSLSLQIFVTVFRSKASKTLVSKKPCGKTAGLYRLIRNHERQTLLQAFCNPTFTDMEAPEKLTLVCSNEGLSRSLSVTSPTSLDLTH